MYAIHRVDTDRHRQNAWLVHLTRGGKTIQMTFSDGTYGGKEQALEVAQAYRDSVLRVVPPLTNKDMRMLVRKDRSEGSSVPGVYYKEPDPMFCSRLARDLGCILDVDPKVIAWLCLPLQFDTELGPHVPDFFVEYERGLRFCLYAVETLELPEIREGAALAGHRYRGVSRAEIQAGYPLANARDMLRYATTRTPLNDRLRLLSMLEEVG